MSAGTAVAYKLALENIKDSLNYLIMRTPTGDLRNELSDLNMRFLKLEDRIWQQSSQVKS